MEDGARFAPHPTRNKLAIRETASRADPGRDSLFQTKSPKFRFMISPYEMIGFWALKLLARCLSIAGVYHHSRAIAVTELRFTKIYTRLAPRLKMKQIARQTACLMLCFARICQSVPIPLSLIAPHQTKETKG